MRTEKEVIRVRAESSDFEDLNHIEELAVDVSDDCDWSRNMYHVALLHQELFGLGTYCFDD